MFGYLPYYWQGEPWAEAILDAMGRELQRCDDRLEAVRKGMLPQFATDGPNGKFLSIWEAMMGLPVAQTTLTEDRRRQLVLAQLRGRNASSGRAWEQAVAQSMGASIWTYQEDAANYTITIYIPFDTGTINSVQVQRLVRKITPAHLELAVVYSGGFIVGEGIVGEDRL
jgi:uncharacterized protein YmfQ (DUF2313 family)